MLRASPASETCPSAHQRRLRCRYHQGETNTKTALYEYYTAGVVQEEIRRFRWMRDKKPVGSYQP
jgi:hypothetical protein